MDGAKLGKWFVGFGVFLIFCGLIGYLSNPAAAKTALMSGGTFGVLSAVWGLWFLKGGRKGPFVAGLLTSILLVAAFSWRATVSWQAWLGGEPKLVAAILITAMWVGTVLTLGKLYGARRVISG